MTLTLPNSTTLRPLFGGGMEALIPPEFIDASEIREVPDNQEVFVDVQTDQSLIVEILEIPDDCSNVEEMARYHFSQLAEANDALEHLTVHSVENIQLPKLPDTPSQVLVGTQFVTKYHRQDTQRDAVNIYLAVVRLQNVEADILVSWNQPVGGPGVVAGATPSVQDALQRFKMVVMSLCVKDWGLFG